MSEKNMELEPKFVTYYNNNVFEDEEDIIRICLTAASELHERFRMNFRDNTGEYEPRIVAACFGKIYETILLYLQKLEKQYSDFEINICDRLMIGYSNNENEDDEKSGNFMIYMRHLNMNKKNDSFDDPSLQSSQRRVIWSQENIIDQPERIEEISIAAKDALKEIDVVLSSSNCIMPIFVTVYEAVISYLKIRRRELDLADLSINFVSCFEIGVMESEDGMDDIYIKPNINSKLILKNDAAATAKYE